jgi:energy-coupling factor transporter ATP-binding protein EcfA2
MTLRPGALRAAAFLAAGFIGFRVVYRVLFHGAEGTGQVVLPLPELRLPDPFGHVVLLGPATADGLWAAAASALPIAITILVFGVLNALLDVPRLLARAARRGPLRGIARTLAVAWATLPALADAVRRVRFALRLRGERGGVRVLTPVLERTLERATAVAAALELRGLAGRPVDGDCEHPAVVRDLSLWHRDATEPALHLDALTLHAGELTLLTGATGSGKTTLLRALSGLHQHLDGGVAEGTLHVVGHDRGTTAPRDTSRTVGVVLQNPREGFATARVTDEIGLALELRGVAPTIVRARVDEVAARLGIEALTGRDVAGLSAGEATLVAIGAAIAEHPILLLVDEPLADLDSTSRARIVEVLDALAHEAGISVVVAEHRHDEIASIADVRIDVSGGTAREVDVLERRADASAAALPNRTADPLPSARVLDATAITVTHDNLRAVDEVSLHADAGEIVALIGANGAGKSSLLVALATDPAVTVDGETADRQAIALVPDASDDLFLCTTTAAECARADRRAKAPRHATQTRLALFLGVRPGGAEFDTLLATHPRDLSVGQRRCLAIALQLARTPRVLLVDEPTRGLDAAACALVSDALARTAERGAAVIFATHDQHFAALVAHRVLAMSHGRLVDAPEAVAPAAVTRRVAAPGTPTAPGPLTPAAPPRPTRTTPRLALIALLAAANVVALAAFMWPLAAYALPTDAAAAVPFAALALAPLAVIVVLVALDRSVRSAHTLALLGTLAAIGAAIRIVGTGVGGVEAVFILLILAGRAFGARFGLLLGLVTIALSTVVTGTFGPWTPFQMFACAWVGAGAGLLPKRMPRLAEIAMLSLYGVITSYLFGLLMNLWFWPFAIGGGTGISYEPGAPIGQNLASFFVYSLVTSTATWDTLRAITTVIGIVVIGSAVLAALRRAAPVTPQRVRLTTPARERAHR